MFSLLIISAIDLLLYLKYTNSALNFSKPRYPNLHRLPTRFNTSSVTENTSPKLTTPYKLSKSRTTAPAGNYLFVNVFNMVYNYKISANHGFCQKHRTLYDGIALQSMQAFTYMIWSRDSQEMRHQVFN